LFLVRAAPVATWRASLPSSQSQNTKIDAAWQAISRCKPHAF
jgi:hypothetical protein